MSSTLLIEQTLNGVQFGLMLFLLAAGLTLVLGIMDTINLAHGSLYMVGAYLTAALAQATGSFALAVPLAIAATALVGVLLEVTVLRALYRRDHLSQVLATFALILIANELVRIVFGAQPVMLAQPAALSGFVELLPGLRYPVYRLMIIGAGSGNDVAAALRSGVKHVDAVEIDPAILKLGKATHPMRPYDDPRVTVVVDDAEQGITDVVRGADLLGSTPRQIYLQHQLGFSTPRYAHVPVAVNRFGEKLSKQTLAAPIHSDHCSRDLVAALRFLGQEAALELERARAAEIWAWASSTWRLDRVPRARACLADGTQCLPWRDK